jgi:UDP-glucose 4-epimerase
MKVLAIGGSGFIGGAVIDALPRRTSVTVYDQQDPQRDDVAFVRGSLLDRDLLDRTMRGHDVVLHFAAMLGVVACQKDESAVVQTNVDGTKLVLELAAKHRVRRLCFSSSSEIYGDGVASLFKETDTPQPKSPYGKSKVAGEALIREFAERHNITSTVVRFFNVYGPRQRRDFVVGRFCYNAIHGLPLQVHGTGEQTRTFTYCEDAARATVSVLLNPHKGGRPFEIYNVASRETATIRHLAERVLRIAGSTSRLVTVPFETESLGREPALEINRRAADITKLSDATGYAPQIGLDEGLRRTLLWYAATGSPHASTSLGAHAPPPSSPMLQAAATAD